MSLMVSISGIRGIVGESLTPEIIVKYASAYAKYCRRGNIIIGRDGRITGKNIADMAVSALLQSGCDVTDLGICPTPTVALAVERFKAAGGISVTASHNPMIWNGMKFFAPTGLFLDADQNRDLWRIAEEKGEYVSWEKQGKYRENRTFLEEHIRKVLSLPYVHTSRIRRRKFKIALDCINSAGGIIVPSLLEKLGCRVVGLNCDAAGIFKHAPEPVPENLSALCAKVRSSHADMGIAVDPDVDRLVLIDEKGRPFGEEYTIASCVQFILAKTAGMKRKHGRRTSGPCKVVINLSTTRAVDDIAGKFGAETIRTPVGEINVAKKMKETGAVIGGEGSGGVILPKIHTGRDAIVGIGLILQYLTEFNGKMSELKSSLPRYFITKGKVSIGGLDPEKILERIRNAYSSSGSVNTEDGLKIDFPDSWIHMRKSNTEPIIRIIAEAPAKSEADRLVVKFTAEILAA
jgi:phosphomannomutase